MVEQMFGEPKPNTTEGTELTWWANDDRLLVTGAPEKPADTRIIRKKEKMSKLETRQISKTYRGRRVVDDVTVFVQQGEVVGLLGPNGAGKTTSFYMIVGLISPDSGQHPGGRSRTSPTCPCTSARCAASATCRRRPASSASSRWKRT